MREWRREMTRAEFLAVCGLAFLGGMAGCNPEGVGTAVVSPESKKRLKPGADLDAGDGKGRGKSKKGK